MQSNSRCYSGSEAGLSCEAISAKATVEQAQNANRTTTLSWWQFSLGVLTFLAAVAAASYAKDAAAQAKSGAREAKRSADAAEHAVRCHIVIDAAKIKFGGRGVGNSVTVVVRNDGDTPARKVRVTARLQISEGFRGDDGEWYFSYERTRRSPKTVWHDVDIGRLVPARSAMEFTELVGNFWLTREEMSPGAFLRAGVQIKVKFVDVFGNRGERLEYRDIGDLQPVILNKTYPLNVNFGGGETEEWD